MHFYMLCGISMTASMRFYVLRASGVGECMHFYMLCGYSGTESMCFYMLRASGVGQCMHFYMLCGILVRESMHFYMCHTTSNAQMYGFCMLCKVLVGAAAHRIWCGSPSGSKMPHGSILVVLKWSFWEWYPNSVNLAWEPPVPQRAPREHSSGLKMVALGRVSKSSKSSLGASRAPKCPTGAF